MPRESSHRVVVIVDENSNPFELGCATEVFGLHRPEIGSTSSPAAPAWAPPPTSAP